MSRSGYSDEWCPEMNLYRATVDRAIAGKRGQAFLGRLAEALDAMPKKELEESVLVAPEGCCAMGAVAVAEGIDVSDVDPYDRDAVAKLFNIAPCMAAEIAYENDESEWRRARTTAERWQYMRDWVSRNLRSDT